MLGEDHSLLHEFPEHKIRIQSLAKSDATFKQQMREYDRLDKEIRELELNNGPIDDDAMHQLKHQRATLKDSLYQQLIRSS